MMISSDGGGYDEVGGSRKGNKKVIKHSVDCVYQNLLYLIVNLPDLRITSPRDSHREDGNHRGADDPHWIEVCYRRIRRIINW